MTNNSNTNPLIFLDGLRGIAAFQVLVGHIRAFVWEGYSVGYQQHPELYSTLDKLMMYFFSSFRFGHQMVVFFFILSGFVIHLRYARQLKNENLANVKFNYPDYLGKRIKRIYPPWLFMMLLAFVIDRLGLWLQLPVYKEVANYPLITSMVHYDHSWQTFFSNLFFLETIYFPIWATLLPVWSLVLEWWIYMLYPLLWFTLRKSVLPATLLVAVCYFACLYSPAGALGFLDPFRGVFLNLPLWWLGVLLAEIYVQRLRISLAWLSPLTVFLFVAVLPTSILQKLGLVSWASTLQGDFMWAVGFSGLVALLLTLQAKGLKLTWLEKLKPLGDMSYTLYIAHYPMAIFLGGLALWWGKGQLPQHSWFIVLSLVLIMPICYLIHLYIEKPFMQQKKHK